MGIETPGMLNGGTVLTGPSTKGTAGQPLIGDGEGNVEFGDVAGSAFNPASLGGPITLLKFDEGSGRVARNAFSNAPIAATNLFPYPEQLFAVFGIANGVTVTPLAGNNPNGIATATRLQFSSGASYLQFTNLGLSSAQYTISVYAKANAGSNVTLRLGTSNFTYSPGRSVPNASGWVRIDFTVTEALSGIYIMNDGTNAADVLIWGAMINTGATAAAYPTQDMSALISGTSAPAWSSAGLEFTGDHYAAVIQNQPTTFTALTDYVVFKQSDLVSYAAIAHKAGDATKYISPSPGTSYNAAGGKLTRIGGTTLQQRSKCDDGKWHVLARRWDGTTMDLMLDGTLIGSVSASTGFTGGAFLLGNIPGNANLGFRGTLGGFALYSASHSTDDMRAMSDWLIELVNARGGNARRLETIVAGDGDSIIADASGSYFDYGVNDLFPSPQAVNKAVGGSTYADLTTRAAALDALLQPNKQGVLIVAAGINDLTISDHSAATVAADEKAYILNRIKAGWTKILLCTTLPSTRTNANTRRATLNAARLAESAYGEHGTYFVKVCDIGADATYGQNADASDTLKYSDGTHPTQATQLGLAPTITADLETLLSYEVTGGGAPSGAAGGDLTGTYPNPTIGTGKVTSAHIADGTIVNGDISASAAIALSKLATDPLARANHTGTQAASTITGVLDDSQIPSGITRDSELTSAVAAAVAALVGTAGTTLDTLGEIAAALNSDPDFYNTITAAIGAKVSKSLYDANTILAANSDDTPAALTVAVDTLVGRLTGGNIAALSVSQIVNLLKGTSGTTLCVGNDSRLSDTRTPTDRSATFAKLQAIGTGKLLGRSTAGSGDVEEITCTAAGRALIDDADAAAQRVTLGVAVNGRPFSIKGTVSDGTYVLTASSRIAVVINGIYQAKLGAGSCTIACKIGGTNVTGLSAVSVTTSAADTSASGANNVSIGSRVTLVISGASGASDLELTMEYTR